MKKLLFTLAAAVLMAGCTIVNEGGLPVGKNLIQASSKDDTRTVMAQDGDEFCHNWVKGDAFALMDGAKFIKYELVGEGGSTNEVFTGDAPVGPGPYYVYYPYKDVFMDIYTDATIKSTFTWVFPKEVEFEGGNIAGEDAMIGLSVDGKTVSMKNMCGYVRLNIFTPSVSFLDELEIIAPGGEGIAGPYHVDLTPEGIPELTPMNGYNNERLSNKVTVKFPSKTMTIAGTELFIPLPAVELSQGLVFVLKGNFDGEPEIRLTSSTATLERNIVLVMPDYWMPSEEAQIGDVIYETVGEAFAAANESDEPCTITLLRSCVAAKRLHLNGEGTGDVTLDLRGKTLSMTDQIRVTGRNLTIVDSAADEPENQGTISSSYSGGRVIYVDGADASCVVKAGNIISTAAQGMWTNGTIVMEGNSTLTTAGSGIYLNGPEANLVVKDNVKISSEASNCIYVNNARQADIGGDVTVTNSGAATLYIVKGTLNVTGGTYSRSGSGNGYIIYTEGANAVVNVSGGYFDNFSAGSATSIATATSGGGTINVSGGYFNSYGINPVSRTSPGEAYVTGGYFNKGIQPTYAGSLVNVLNDDPATCETYPFTVAEGEVVAITTQSTNTWNCGSIECAFKSANQRASANGNTTATLQTDVTAVSTLAVDPGNSYSITLDLKGHAITSSVSPVISTESGFTLNDSEEGGMVATSGYPVLNVAGGSTTVNGGMLNSAGNAVNVASGGKLIINDCKVYSSGASDIVSSGSTTIYGGYYRNDPASWLAPSAEAKRGAYSFNGMTFYYKVEAVVATVNGVGYPTLADAMAAVVAYDGSDQSVTLKLKDDIQYNATMNLTHETKPVILDLNGHVLSTTVLNLIYPTAGTLTITDSATKKGKITSSSYQVLYIGGSSQVTVSDCVIEGTLAEASAWNAQTLILHGGSTVTTYSNARINATGFQTAIRMNNTGCKVTVDGNTEVSSGTNATRGFYTIINNNGTLTINGGSFWTKSTPTTADINAPSVIHHSNGGAKTTINGGYFYGAEDRTISGNYGSIVLNGGYYDKAASSSKVSYGSGKAWTALDAPVTHVHQTTGKSLSYGFSVE